MKERKNEQKQIMEKEIDNATDSIANAAYDNKFFKAVKYICNPETKQ
jgi:hypothetical protein